MSGTGLGAPVLDRTAAMRKHHSISRSIPIRWWKRCTASWPTSITPC